ncbi:MAG TPA: AMP-binding protein, partial [Terrimesophilobacter sp.]|nr:AMP-binding protein [Terrimesophilobacter sp.]
MSRALRALRARDAHEVQDAVAAALAGDGPALLPIAAEAPDPAVPATVGDDVALVVHTSGSTGDSKLVALSADAVRASSALAAERLGGHGQWLLALPAHYIAGLNVLARSLAAGTMLAVVPPGPFEATEFTKAAATLSHERTFTSLVPAQLGRLLDDPAASAALRSFTAVLVGGQAT